MTLPPLRHSFKVIKRKESHAQWPPVLPCLRRAGLDFGDEFLFFYPPVLKPNGDLPLGQVSDGRNLSPLVLCDKFVGAVLFLQFLQLHLGVGYSLLSAAAE